MPPVRTFFTLAMSSLLAGCALGPSYVKPAMPMPERYLNQGALEQRHGAASTDLAAWWMGFGDPALSRLVSLSLEQNLDLAQAAARVAQVRAGLGVANAALLPSGSVNGQAARARQSVETALGQVLSTTPDFDRYGSAYEVNLGTSWELDIFGGLCREKEAALADYQASEAGAIAARLAVAAQTADIYLTVRGLQSRLDLVRRQVHTQTELLSTVKLLYSKGLAAELQMRQAEGALAQVRASVPTLEHSLDAAMNALDVMLGAQPGTYRAELTETRPIPVAPRLADIGTLGELLRRRPDLIMAERRLAASHARIGAAVAEYYPKFSLGGMVGSATSISGGNLFSSGASQAAALFGLRWRLFDFARIEAQISAAKGKKAELLAAYRLAVLRASEDVENALSALVKREEQVRVLTQGVESLGRARSAASAAYQGGVMTLIEVLQADENLLRASDAQIQAQIESGRVVVSAFRALGGGWNPGKIKLVASE